jgi:hypothetical protein
MPQIPQKIVEQMAKRPGYQQEIASAGIFLRNGLGLKQKTLKGLVAKKMKQDKEADEWSLFESIFTVIFKHKYQDDFTFSYYAPANKEELSYVLNEPSEYGETVLAFWRLPDHEWQVFIVAGRDEKVFKLLPGKFVCQPGSEKGISVYTANLKEWAIMFCSGTEEPVLEYVEALLGT